MDDDLANLDSYLKTRSPAYNGVSFEDIVKAFLSERQKTMLRKLINFKFKKHPRYNLPNKRLKILEKLIQKRIQEFLGNQQ